MLPIIAWLAYTRDLASNIGSYTVMALYWCVAGGAFGAFFVGPVAYLVGTIFLAPIRHFERSMFPAAVAEAASDGRWSKIANATVAVLVLLAAAIAMISVLYYAGVLAHAGAIRLLALF